MKLLSRQTSPNLAVRLFASGKTSNNRKGDSVRSSRTSRSAMKDELSSSCHSTRSSSSSTLSSSSNHSSTSRQVSFSNKVALHEIELLDDPDQIDVQWYSHSDYCCFKARDANLVRAMRESETVAENEALVMGESTRGLEKDRSEQKRRMNQNKREAYAVVMSQQDIMAGPESIAKAYGRVARSASRDALILGRLDANHATTTTTTDQ